MTSTKLHPTRWVEWTHDGGTRQGRVVYFATCADECLYEYIIESFGEYFAVEEDEVRDVVPRREWEKQ